MPQLLNDMTPERARQVFGHPLVDDTYYALPNLITGLRQCRTYEDYYHFQQELLGRVLDVQEHSRACTRVVLRLGSHKSVPTDAPELRTDTDLNELDTWKLEVDVCERVGRQLRSIADALAWRVFNYDRQVIVALSRNDPPGPMAGKKGLDAERKFLTQTWDDEHSFVLLHDLTTCLRIGDGTRFKVVGSGYEAYLHEIKADPSRKRSVQSRRKRLAEEAIRDGGPLPNDPDGRLVPLDIPYKTHLNMLRDAFDKAAIRGVVGMKVPGGRSLVAANLPKGYELWPEDEFIGRTEKAHEVACRRAGILDSSHLIGFRSDDMVGRYATMPPWAIYPLPPAVCASLITDMAVFIVTLSSESLLNALQEVGLTAQWLLPHDLERLEYGRESIRIHDGVRRTELRSSELYRLAFELVDMPTWVQGVKALFARKDLQGRPWHYFAGEWKVWE
ncbi:MAG: hypothetical protein ACRDRJ_02180 [Streptosporangiaceae bacterium]